MFYVYHTLIEELPPTGAATGTPFVLVYMMQ